MSDTFGKIVGCEIVWRTFGKILVLPNVWRTFGKILILPNVWRTFRKSLVLPNLRQTLRKILGYEIVWQTFPLSLLLTIFPPTLHPPSFHPLFIFSTKIQNFTRFSSFSAFPRICFKKSFLLVLTIKWGQESATWTTAKCSFEEGIFRNTSRQIFLRLVLFQVMHSGSRVFGWLNMTAIILGSALVLALPLSRKSLTRIFVTYFQRA